MLPHLPQATISIRQVRQPHLSSTTLKPHELTTANWAAGHSPRWRERRAAANESAAAAAQLADAEQRWGAYVCPEAARLEAAIYQAR